jgi:hypothetical protein
VAAYTIFLTVMTLLFASSALALLALTLAQAWRRRRERAAVYLGLTAIAGLVAAGFYFFRRLL